MSDEFYHYGVPGMKWGVRKDRTSRASARSKAKSMSDRELQDVINRINLEQRYVDAVSPQPAAVKVVQSVIKNQSTNYANKLVAVGVGFAVKAALNSRLNN